MSKKKLSKQELFYYKVKKDRKWYIENFLKIRDKSATIVPFTLNKAQNIVNDLIEQDERDGKPKRYIVLKARQMGLSTLFEGLIFQDTSTHENKNSLIIAHEEQASSNLFNMSKLYFEYLPDVLKPMKKYANGKILSFENPTNDDAEKAKNPGLRSKISIATAGSGEVGRSSTVHNLHASEVAFFPDAKVTMLGLLQAIPDQPNTMAVLESTANGVGDWFHDMWKKAERGENEFTPIFLPWFIQPEYTRAFRSESERTQFLEEISIVTKDYKGDPVHTYEWELMQKFSLTPEQLNWRRWTVKNKCQGDEILFMQEYPSTAEEAFISSGRPKFSIKALKKYQTITREPEKRGYLIEKEGKVEFLEDPKGYISIWKDVEPNRFYAIGADVAEGLAHGDYSCAYVGDTETFDVVARWHGHIDPDLFGVELVKLSRYYNEAYLGVENNNHGLTTLNSIKKAEYWNLFFSKSYDRIADTMTQKLGWTTSIRTKPLMIDKLAEFIREHYLGIYDDTFISEAYTYVIEDNGKTNAQDGCHDDTVMAMAILLQLMLEGKGEYYTPEIPLEQRKEGRAIQHDIIDPAFEDEKDDEFSI
jgi:hypothetical protein